MADRRSMRPWPAPTPQCGPPLPRTARPTPPWRPAACWPSGEPFDETLDVWISTQSPHETALAAARTLGLAVHQVRVHMGDVGGGFGQKVFLGREEFAVMVCARRLGRPVRWIEGRSENLTSSNHARRDRADVSLGATADGRFVAATVDHLEDNGAYANGGSPGNGTMACVHLPGPYRIGDVGWRTASVYTNTCGRGAYRGPWQIESVARELIVDMLARELGHRSAGAAPAQRAARRGPAAPHGDRPHVRPHLSRRVPRSGRGDDRLRRLPGRTAGGPGDDRGLRGPRRPDRRWPAHCPASAWPPTWSPRPSGSARWPPKGRRCASSRTVP